MGAGGAAAAALAAREDDWPASEEAARLRSAASAEEPGRRRVRVRAVSSKLSPDSVEDSVELRSVSTDMVDGSILRKRGQRHGGRG